MHMGLNNIWDRCGKKVPNAYEISRTSNKNLKLALKCKANHFMTDSLILNAQELLCRGLFRLRVGW